MATNSVIAAPLPTDLEILTEIYEQYYDEYAAFDQRAPNRGTKVYVPIDCELIARRLAVDHDIVFGRLYYVLDPKYRYKQWDDSLVHLFVFNELPSSPNSVHFPFLAGILADLREVERRHTETRNAAWLSLAVSAVALLLSILGLAR